MFKRTNFSTPSTNKKQPKLSSLYSDSDEYDIVEPDPNIDENEEGSELQQPHRVKHVNQYIDTLTSNEQKYQRPPYFNKSMFESDLGTISKVGKRAKKTVENAKKTISDNYTFQNKDGIDLSKYRELLFDILINGNYRIKFSPKCAVRKSAELYCKSKFDKSGYPLYRLIPARSDTKDPFGNAICDLNGDKVEDIVIVDRLGRPVIINGFKLVKANPYKKIWQTCISNGNTKLPFEIWLRSLLDANKKWDYTEEEWNNGKFISNPENYDEKMKRAIEDYEEVGLSKPRISTRLTARGFWSSMFAKIWQVSINEMFTDVTNEESKVTTYYSALEPLKTLFSYFKVCSAMFIVKFETKVMINHNFVIKENNEQNENQNKEEAKAGDWIRWLKYKQAHKKEVNAEIGILVQNFYKDHVKADLPINEDFKPNTEIKDEELKNVINNVFAIVFRYGLDFNEENNKEHFDKLATLARALSYNEVSKRDKQELRQIFCDNIDIFIDQKVGGNYIESKTIYKQRKDKFVDKADTYIKARDDA
ncbi:hypothetical protein [uncultured Brachyspira sp.]|uniref:hypothetical protein n=1 Tax=uncultured Brachyspira sp. TaxID=221953 RepID=UPI0025DA69FE|nr:hypothetical protein [uncultured Brachyspira sp.]